MRDGTAFYDTQANAFIFGATNTVGIRKPSLVSRDIYVGFLKYRLTQFNVDSKKALSSTSFITPKEIRVVMIFRLSVMFFFIIQQAKDHYACTFFAPVLSILSLTKLSDKPPF